MTTSQIMKAMKLGAIVLIAIIWVVMQRAGAWFPAPRLDTRAQEAPSVASASATGTSGSASASNAAKPKRLGGSTSAMLWSPTSRPEAVRAGQADDRAAVFHATIDSTDPNVRMWAIRAFQDCAIEYGGDGTTSLAREAMEKLEQEPRVDASRKEAQMLRLARQVERCKGFAGVGFTIADMTTSLRRATAEGALSALALTHLYVQADKDSPVKAAAAQRVVAEHGGDELALEYATPYLVNRLLATNPGTSRAIVEAAYAQAICQIVDHCATPSNYLRRLETVHDASFSTVEEAHRILFPRADDQARLRSLSQAIRTALQGGDIRYFGLGGG